MEEKKSFILNVVLACVHACATVVSLSIAAQEMKRGQVFFYVFQYDTLKKFALDLCTINFYVGKKEGRNKEKKKNVGGKKGKKCLGASVIRFVSIPPRFCWQSNHTCILLIIYLFKKRDRER